MIKADINKFKNKIFTAPAGLFLKFLKDNCVDLALIDPPYGIDYCGQLKRKLGGKRLSVTKYGWNDYDAANSTWDIQRISPSLINEVLRVSKEQIIWGGNYYGDLLPATKCQFVWNKKQRDFTLADGEVAWTSFDKALRIFDYSRSEYKADEPVKIHPTQKPIKLFEWCLTKARLKPGATVLDCFCGSATTAIACYNLGLNYICLDKDPSIIAKARNRFWEHQRQLRFIKPEDVAIQQTLI